MTFCCWKHFSILAFWYQATLQFLQSGFPHLPLQTNNYAPFHRILGVHPEGRPLLHHPPGEPLPRFQALVQMLHPQAVTTLPTQTPWLFLPKSYTPRKHEVISPLFHICVSFDLEHLNARMSYSTLWSQTLEQWWLSNRNSGNTFWFYISSPNRSTYYSYILSNWYKFK